MSFDTRLITPQLCFDTQAEDAARFYVDIFEQSEIVNIVTRLQDDPGGRAGTVLTVTVRLRGYEYLFCNGGPHFRFSDAISMYVLCESQAEIDYYWERLTSGGGQAIECGWLTDRFGVSWQIVPASHWEHMKSTDAQAVSRMLQALAMMTKPDADALNRAFKGQPVPA